MKPPKCRLCHEHHWLNEAHKFATNKESATNIATNKDHGATNIVVDIPPDKARVEVAGVADTQARTKNRRKRETYNAYQRDYMRKRRSEAR